MDGATGHLGGDARGSRAPTRTTTLPGAIPRGSWTWLSWPRTSPRSFRRTTARKRGSGWRASNAERVRRDADAGP